MKREMGDGMNKKTNPICFKEKIMYGLFSFVSNIAASWMGLMITKALISVWIKLFGNMTVTGNNTFAYLTMFPLTLIISWVLVVLLTKMFMSERFGYYDDENTYKCNIIRVILPGEILRWLVAMFPLGLISSTGYVALLPTALFENIYLKYWGRHNAVRQHGEFIPADYWAYSLCYLIYIAIYIAGLIAIYRYLASREESED